MPCKAQVDHDAVGGEGHLQTHLDSLLEEDQGELLVGQRQSPDALLRLRVRAFLRPSASVLGWVWHGFCGSWHDFGMV